MFEFGARLVIALAAVGTAFLTGQKGAPIIGQAAAVFAAYSAVAWLIERKGMRNPTISVIVAILDSIFVAICTSLFDRSTTFGFLVLAPVLYGCVRHGANPVIMAPIAAAANLAAINLFSKSGITAVVIAESVAIALIGFLANPEKQKIVEIQEVEVIVEKPVAQADPTMPDDYLEFRENFRALRDHAAQVERKSRKDRLGTSLLQALDTPGEGTYQALAKKLCEISGAEGLTLYTMTQFGDRLVVQSVCGHVPEKVHTASFEAPSSQSENQLRHKIDKMLLTMKSASKALQGGSVIVKNRGKVVGMISLFHGTSDGLDEARLRCEEAAEVLGSLLRMQMDRDEETRRLREAEILYAVASTSLGSDTKSTLSNRIVRELWDVLNLDHLSIQTIDGNQAIPMATRGNNLDALGLMSFGFGPGVEGWIKSGSPELAMLDARGDMRLEATEAIRRRIGSLVVIPIQTSDQPEACLVAMSSRVHGIDAGQLETLRVIGSELSHAMARISGENTEVHGLASPKEFFKSVNEAKEGCLVYMQVLRREDLIETYGSAAVTHAIAKFANRMRAKLPAGAMICRRDEGDFVVLLRTADEQAASSWANDAAATASMIGLTTPDGRSKIPLALRAKTAVLDRQVQDILEQTQLAAS